MKKSRLLCLLVGLLLPFATINAQDVWDGSVATSFAGGSGTQDDPYLIETGAQLAYLAQLTNENAYQTSGMYYKLVDDIVLNEDVLDENYELNGTPVHEWIPIADVTYDTMSNSFKGDFDGDGHVISGVYVVRDGGRYPYAGLFGSISDNAVVHDLAVIDSYSYCTYTCGIITANMTGSAVVRRCYADGRLAGNNQYSGHIVGTLTNGQSTVVEYCYTKGLNSCSPNAEGGIAGYTSSANSVHHCYSLVRITGSGSIGGVIGQDNGHGTLAHLYFDQTVSPSLSCIYGSSYDTCEGKTTVEMQSEEFAQLLGEPFVYLEDNYPAIEGLVAVGEQSSLAASGNKIIVGTLTNGRNSTIKFYKVYEGGVLSKSTRYADAGTKVYMKITIGRRLILSDSSVKVTNNTTSAAISVTKEADGIFSFTMPEAEVTVSAAFTDDQSRPAIWDGTIATEFAGGTGTKNDPYLISSGEELAYLAKITNEDYTVTEGKFYKLMNDIVLNEDVLDENFQLIGTPVYEWTPIALTTNRSGRGFRGDFDGNCYTISGLYIQPTNNMEKGLFGSIGGNAVVHDLAIVDSYMDATYTNGLLTGATYDNSQVLRCYVAGSIKTSNESGLIIGWIYGGAAKQCYAYGAIEGTNYVGGLVGGSYSSTENLNSCFCVVKVTGGAYGCLSQGSGQNIFYDTTVAPDANSGNATGKTTTEMQTEEFAQLLGAPFVFDEGNYPYIDGLPKVGEQVVFNTSGYRLNVGQLTMAKGSTLGYYTNFDGTNVSKSTRRADAGDVIYLKVTLGKRMVMKEETLTLINDSTGQSIALNNVADGIWSFVMPNFSVTVSATFQKDPNLPPLWEGDVAEEFAEGEGTEDDPYLIHDGDELAYLAQLCNANGELTKGRYYELASDIVLNEDVLNDDFTLNGTPANVWTPIGNSSSNKFQGVFDGKDHTISGMYIPSGSESALFTYTNNATIRNLSLIDSYVYASYSAGLVYNAAASDTSTISRCYVEASVSASSSYNSAAELVHTLGEKCYVENCYTTGTSTYGQRAGLIYSMIKGSSIRNCYSAMEGSTAIRSANDSVFNVYSDEDLGASFTSRDDYCSKHTIEMHTTDFATRMGAPFEYVLGNYPYIPGLKKIGENREWKTPEDPTHGGAGGTWDGSTSIIFANGTGTESDPYIINNGAQLSYLAKLTNANGDLTKGKYYQLGADISLNADSVLTSAFALNGTPTNTWEPIGKDSNHKFQGVFDGKDHTISGMYISSGSESALFSYTNNATIRNLSLIDSYVYASYSAGLVYNAAATDTSTISRCYVEASVSASSSYNSAAALVHTLGEKCYVENCYTTGTSTYGQRAGLIYSMTKGSSIRNCFSTMKSATAIRSANDSVFNVYSDEDLGASFTSRDDYCSKHTIEMHTTDFATRMGTPFEYVLGNYPYIPGLKKIGENREWKTPEDPTHGGAGGTWDGSTSIIFASGTGTESDPYIINNGAQLSYLAKLTNANGNLTKGKYYQLGADITLNGDSVITSAFALNGTPTNTWEPIGKDSNHKFQGVFDGKDHTISGMYIPSGSESALFSYTNNATIRNLSLIDSYVYASYSAGLVFNAAATDTSTISRCYVEASVSASSSYNSAAGLVHTLGEKCYVENCYTTGTSTYGQRAGLIYSMTKGSSIRNCYSAMKGSTAIRSANDSVFNVYSDEDLGTSFTSRDDYCSKHTIEMHTTDFATRMGAPFEYVLGNYPYIPGLKKIGENREWKTPEDPTHGGAGGTWDGSTSIIFASGTGTESDPYIINNGAQLSYLAKLTNANGDLTKGRYYRLEADIALNENVLSDTYELPTTPANSWEPIGKDSNHKFQGVFEGNNYTISGMYISSSSESALFSYTNNATIRNLSLIDSYVYASYSAGLVYNAAATDTSTISRCYVDASVSASSSYNSAAALVHTLGAKCYVENCYTTGTSTYGQRAGLIYSMVKGSSIRNCYSAMEGATAIRSANDSVFNVYFDSNRAGTTYSGRDDFRSAETPEMLSTDFAARMGEPFEYAVGYYPYIYGLHKIDNEGKTSIVSGYTLQLGKLENGSDCDIEFYRGYHKKSKELSLPVVAGSKVFVDNATTIYVKVSPTAFKRLSEEGLTVTNTTGSKLDITEVDYDLYSFQITDDAVTVTATFLDGSYCGDPAVNNGRNVKWLLNGDKSKLTIGGVGKMVAGDWVSFGNTVQTIAVGEGVVNIPSQAFKGMNKATTMTLPASVETIGAEAFSGCSATVDLRLCTQLTALHAHEFAQFTGTVYLPATVTAIEADAFSGSYTSVQHVFSPVANGYTLYANDRQVPDHEGWGDIVAFGINANEAIELHRYIGFNVNTIANADGIMACYSDADLSKEIPNGMKAVREDDQTPVYIKVTPKDTKILFHDGLTVKAGSSTLPVTQEADDVFSFLMPKSPVTISARFDTGGYCGTSTVNNGHNLVWTISDGTLAFQKNSFAEGDDLTMGSNAPWSTLGSSISKVDLSSVTNIGSNAFSSCTELTGIVLPASPVLTVGENALTPEIIVIVPTESWSDYLQATGWSDYAEQMNRDKETLTLPNNLQWRTYYSKVGRLLPDGVKAYTITNIGDTEVMTSQALDYIPAGQAVLIENTGKTARAIEAETSLLTYAQTDTPVCLLTAPEDNLLQWITEPTPVSAGEGYTLYKDEFVKVSSGTLPAGIAFLPASGNSRSRLGIYVFEDETTHISSLGNETIGTDNGHWFTLDGKKLSGKPVNKGVYLKNGKKVVIR